MDTIPKTILVTGTDTGIGKTVFSAALTHALKAAYWKPIQSGRDDETDSQVVARLSDCEIIPEAYCLDAPISPHLSAEAENIEIDTTRMLFPDIRGPLVVEAAGGIMVPLNRDTLFLDLFVQWNAPIVLCARTSLGTINHSLLSLAALHDAGCRVLGIAFIGPAEPEVENTICDFGRTRNLGRLPFLDPLTPHSLSTAFSEGFDVQDFTPHLSSQETHRS